jgi:hypothetical protein
MAEGRQHDQQSKNDHSRHRRRHKSPFDHGGATQQCHDTERRLGTMREVVTLVTPTGAHAVPA